MADDQWEILLSSSGHPHPIPVAESVTVGHADTLARTVTEPIDLPEPISDSNTVTSPNPSPSGSP